MMATWAHDGVLSGRDNPQVDEVTRERVWSGANI